MNINVSNRQNIVDINDKLVKLLEKVIKKSLEIEGIDNKAEVSVLFVDNNEIKELNKNFRGIDKETDVLSFPQYCDLKSIKDKEQNLILGDIVISLEKSKEQALEYGHSFEREVAFLTAHSMFHLLGYDHDNEENTRIMRKKEERVLELLGILR
ncbi:MAG: putative rRNA maturation factor [Candidatus Petromonas sp.]|jgi:probable rRNA maturation factor|nr:putative rRNA maturation factor [Candidatus Petromonas sp.]